MSTLAAPLQVTLQFWQQLAHATDLETYQVEVIQAPGRGWGGPLTPSGLDDAHVQAIRVLYRSFLQRQRASGGMVSELEVEPLRVAGSQLFRTLPETIQARLRQATALARQKGCDLELNLVFDVSARPLANLPWELLHDPGNRYFLALQGGVTRQVLLPATTRIDRAYHPHAIIGLWAAPDDVAPLAIRRQFHPSPGYDDGIMWLEGRDSLRQLELALSANQFDGLHIVAHGRAGESWSDLSLAFVDAAGHTQWLSPDQIATFIGGYPTIRFVYLDVCSSGSSSSQEFAAGGLAHDLLGHGVSIVIAMQDDISQSAAGLLAQVFYQAWSHGDTIMQGMASARRAVRVQQDDPAQWSVPMLYLQQRVAEESQPLADRLLDRVTDLLCPINLIFLALMLWVGRLSFALAETLVDGSTLWLTVTPLIAESCLLSVSAATAMRHGQRALGEKYHLTGRQWLEVLTHKYTAAFIWGMMMWLFIWLVWLGVSWAGLGTRLAAGLRQAIWAIGLLGVIGASYVGARQAIRQKQLFLRIGRSPLVGGDWFLLFAMALSPVGVVWLVSTAWPWLGATPIGFYVTLGLLFVVVIVLGRGQNNR